MHKNRLQNELVSLQRFNIDKSRIVDPYPNLSTSKSERKKIHVVDFVVEYKKNKVSEPYSFDTDPDP
jgi:hypothetical protein